MKKILIIVILFNLISCTIIHENKLNEIENPQYKRAYIYYSDVQGDFNSIRIRIILPLILLSLIWGVLKYNLKSKKSNDIKVAFSYIAPFVIIIWSIVWYSGLFQSYKNQKGVLDSLNSSYQDKSYETVEGKVKVLRTQPYEGHNSGDLISINGIQFEYSFFVTNAPYYHLTISHGGILKNDKLVRIHHINGKIIEIFVLGEQPKDE